MRLQAKVRLVVAIRDAFGEAEAYVGGKCAVECRARRATRGGRTPGRGGLGYARTTFLNAAEALDAFNEHARSERGRVGRLAAVCGASGAAAPAWLYKVAPAAA
jgi:hypothetical protein